MNPPDRATQLSVAPNAPVVPVVPILPMAPGDTAVIALVGLAHGTSHFFHLLLPPLFPWLMPAFGLGFSEIGATMTVFFVISGVGQALAGFAVDRFGAVRVLLFGMTCFVLACLGLGLVARLPYHLYAVAALAGLGNSVFHPADFSLLNREVTPSRLGHAFSMHGVSGNLGWALAPVFVTGLAAVAGWQVAALAAGAMALPAMVLLWIFRGKLERALPEGAHGSDIVVSAFAFLRVGAVWLSFGFFFFVTVAFGAIQNFATPILQRLYDMPLATAAAALSIYLLAAAGGMFAGGFLAHRHAQHRIIAVVLLMAALLALVLAADILPAAAVLPVMAGIGFCTGTAGPSRDLLVRRAAMSQFGQAAYGRIYGFVYSGLDSGLAMAPLVFGALMDSGRYAAVLIGMAAFQAIAVLTALRVGKSASPAR